MVVFGGITGPSVRNDVWELTLTPPRQWTQLKPTGTAPAARRGHVAVYDPVGDRMIVQGGFGTSSLNDAWALSLSGATPVWTQLSPTGDSTLHALRAQRNLRLGPKPARDPWWPERAHLSERCLGAHAGRLARVVPGRPDRGTPGAALPA
jgi:hypothetical protein